MRHDQTTPSHAARLALAVAATITSSTIPVLAGTTIFAPGVTLEKGWYDVNKKSTQTAQYSDLNMCWAAVSSNLLQYWQDQYIAAGNEIPLNVPNGAGTKIYNDKHGPYELAIFESYIDNWDTSVPGQIVMGVPWYLSGTYPNYSTSSKPQTTNSGGFFQQEYSSFQEQWGADFATKDNSGYSIWGRGSTNSTLSPLNIFSECISSTLKSGAGAINFNTALYGGGHTVTLWGAEFNDNGMVMAVYVTDSDDRASTLAAPELRKYTITSDDAKREIYLSGYNPEASYGNLQITGYYGLPVYIIPEPSAFGLFAGIGAFVLVASRRRLRRV